MKSQKKYKSFGIAILILFIFAGCSKSGTAENAGDQKSVNTQQVASLKGAYKSNDDGSKTTFLHVFYPDGVYVEEIYTEFQPDAGPILTTIRVGMYQQNGDQLNLKQTGANVVIKDNTYTPMNIESAKLIKVDADGSYHTKDISRSVDGQSQPVEDKWSDIKYSPVYFKDSEILNRLRQSIPAQLVTPQPLAAGNPTQNQTQTPNPQESTLQGCIARSDQQMQECMANNPMNANACAEAQRDQIRICNSTSQGR